MADRKRRRRVVVRLQVHKFMYRTLCDSCGEIMVAAEAIPIGMQDCAERDLFIDSFRTGSMRFLSDGGGTNCSECLLEHMIDWDKISEAGDALGLYDDDDER